MIVYADVLFFFNSVVDYLLISITALFLRTNVKTVRQIAASLLGGIFSFYIFLDLDNILIDFIYRIITTVVIVFFSFGYKHFKFFIKGTLSFFLSSVFLFGLTFVIYRLFNVPTIVINNTYFYFNFSPLLAIFISFLTYFTIKLIKRFTREKNISTLCVIEINIGDMFLSGRAYIDTGNLAKDYLSDSELCFVSKDFFARLTGCNSFKEIMEFVQYRNRYRTIPVTTLNETSLLDGLRCDSGKIYIDENVYFLYKPIVVISNNLPEFFDAIISSKAIEKTPENIIKGDKFETA